VLLGLELGVGVAVAVGEDEALADGVGLDATNVPVVDPHPASTMADMVARIKPAGLATLAVFMVLLITTPPAVETGEAICHGMPLCAAAR
jgi:hypothetical protein